ncbi:hypothetical protein GN956_G24933 [Arapaima gigas]
MRELPASCVLRTRSGGGESDRGGSGADAAAAARFVPPSVPPASLEEKRSTASEESGDGSWTGSPQRAGGAQGSAVSTGCLVKALAGVRTQGLRLLLLLLRSDSAPPPPPLLSSPPPHPSSPRVLWPAADFGARERRDSDRIEDTTRGRGSAAPSPTAVAVRLLHGPNAQAGASVR